MISRLPVLAAALCLTVSGCASTTVGAARPAAPVPPTTAATLPTLLLSAADVGAAFGLQDGEVIVATRDVTTPWNDSARFPDPGCLAIAGAAQKGVYAHTDWTAMRGQVLREPPAATTWSHYAVQAVVLFPTPEAADGFFTASQKDWEGCANRELSYSQQLTPDQVWSVAAPQTEHGVLTVSRVQRSPELWSCQRALTVRGTVAVDVEACDLTGPTTAAATIAGTIGDRLPAA